MWMPRGSGFLTNGEGNHENSSKIESKRSHQSVNDISGSELFSNKKQAMEGHNRPAFGVPQMNLFAWNNSPSLHSVSGLFADRSFGPEPTHAINLFDRNIHLVASQNTGMDRKNFEEQYSNTSSTGLSISQTIEDPSSRLGFGGFRNVNVNQAQVAEEGMSEPMAHSYTGGDTRLLVSGPTCSREENNCISLSQTFGESTKNTTLRGPDFSKAYCDFITMDQSFNKEPRSFRPISDIYNKENENFLSMGQPFDKRNANILSMGQSYQKGDNSLMSLGPFYSNQVRENFISAASFTDKAVENQVSAGSTLNKREANIISMAQSHDKTDNNFVRVESNMISFGGFHDETELNQSVSVISSYDSAVNAASEQPGYNELADQIRDGKADCGLNTSKTEVIPPKNKETKTTKRVSPNTFPSNVKSLLSTGMFDGVPVKYYSWSREKNLRGVIKGTGYLCGCKECNHTKVLNAYEFERHANCKTKHPNNHIYFESGKTIYAVVQELKNTPQEMLFDAIQNATGSQINQKNFITWKASYQAAARELQRIYGKEEVYVPSFD